MTGSIEPGMQAWLAERTRAEGFASPVLLDSGWSAGAAFGAAGTPSA